MPLISCPTIGRSVSDDYQVVLSENSEETAVGVCNRLALFILENYQNEYNNNSVNRLNQRTINQIDLEFALDIIEREVITRIENPEAIDIENQERQLVLNSSSASNERFFVTLEEYNSLINYKEHLSLINTQNQDNPTSEVSFCEELENSSIKVAVCVILACGYIGFAVYYFLKKTSNENKVF